MSLGIPGKLETVVEDQRPAVSKNKKLLDEPPPEPTSQGPSLGTEKNWKPP
jgi:hypothetical protein